MNKQHLFGFAALALASSPVSADETKNNSLYGFVTQGYFKSSANNFYGDSQEGSFKFTEAGVGAGYIANKHLSVGGLLLSRSAGGADNGEIRLDHLVFDLKAYSGSNSTAGVRLGRNKIPFGFYNATRDTAMTRPTLLLPQSIYHDHSRNFLINADGLETYYERWDDNGHTKYNLLYEKTNGINNPQTEAYFIGRNWVGNLDSDFAAGVAINHTINKGRTRLAAYVARLPVKYKPGGSDPMPAGRVTTDVAWLSAQHEILPKWTITTEIYLPRIEYEGFAPLIMDRTVYPLGRYIQGTYAHSAQWEFYLRFDQGYRDKHDKDGQKCNVATGRPAFSNYAHDWTVGANYFPAANWMISAEFHRVRGTGYLPVLDNPDPSQTRERWNMLGLQAAYSFR